MLKSQNHKQAYDRDELEYHTQISKPRYQRERKLRPIDVEAMLDEHETVRDAYQGIRIR